VRRLPWLQRLKQAWAYCQWVGPWAWLVCASTGAHGQVAPLLEASYAGRPALVYVPTTLAPSGSRALVVVLHGGLGNAQRIAARTHETGLNMNAVAEEGGFVVAYLNGTPVARLLGADKLGWNAGSCCGLPAQTQVNDVAYIESAVQAIARQQGVDPGRIYGVGHSNGAMMTQRVMCESSLYAAAVPISGALENGATRCSGARGKRLLALHGENDQNVPVSGGQGSKGLSRTSYQSQASTATVWQNSGASYDLQVIKGADHSVDAIARQIATSESTTLSRKLARFFGLI
jgi:poly(3-hydroxybutyrate) depolymerase